MIRATMVCTNCKKEKSIPSEELRTAVMNDMEGELNLCSVCQVLWSAEIGKMREGRAKEFRRLQGQFGIL